MNQNQSFLSRRSFVCLAYALSLLLGLMNVALAKQPVKEDRTLSPYFFVQSGDAKLDQLPLKSTKTEVNIAGVIADVTVTQTYANTGKTPLEAIYVFPASTRAAVHGMKMTIGERVVVAKIQKREEARRQYQEAKQQGKSASLLEQQRPNVFQMNLANIMPGDEIKVEMKYTELIVPEDGVYEFVYPTVVGPRYSNLPESKATPSDKWVENPTLHQGQAPTSTFDINVNIVGGMPVKDVAVPSHKTNIQFDGPNTAVVHLDKQEAYGGNRDFILRYRLAGNKIQTGMLMYQGEKENHFLMTMQPPKRVAPEHIPGREYIFIVDISGSQSGFPLEITKVLMRDLIGKLRPTDRFNLMLFAGSSYMLAEESLSATEENVRKAIEVIDRQRGGGGTEIVPALKLALALKSIKGYSRTFVISTDGYISVEPDVFELIRNNLDQANMFTFGIGTGVNRHLIEGMARVGMGEPFVITNPQQAPAAAERFRKLIESPVLTGIKVNFEDFEAYDVEPLKVPDIMAERPLVLFGKWRGEPTGKIVVTGTSGQGAFREAVEVGKHAPSKNASALPYLWARQRIALLSDLNKMQPNDKRVTEVTELGLNYNLLTAYTSFIAIDSEVRNKGGESATVKQPLPMPQGVSDSAVGAVVSLVGAYNANRLSAPSMAMAPVIGGEKITLAADALFDSGKAILLPEGKVKLDAAIGKLKGLRLQVILVVGHADRLEAKDAAGKQKLSEMRAQAIKDYLVAQGVDASRIYVEGKGDKYPVTGDKCKGNRKSKVLIDCLQPDRRADVEIVANR
ncbi:MAG: von Willebrand factor type like domain [Proteobacteria bacterium]|nr:von Willebrand factor type like domain [Pseudomonadota bacterium]